MIAVLYGTIGNTMVSAEIDMLIKFFIDNNATKYLAKRPKSFDSPDSKLTNKYGAKMTGYSKPRMLSLLQSFIEDYISHCWFIEIINDLLAYDKENIGNDYDLADAIGYALMHIIELKRAPEKNNLEKSNNELSLPAFVRTANNVLIDRSVQGNFDESEDELEEFEKIILNQRGQNSHDLSDLN